MVACKILMAINVAVPLIAVGPVLIALILDDQLVCEMHKVDTANGAVVVADDEIALRHW